MIRLELSGHIRVLSDQFGRVRSVALPAGALLHAARNHSKTYEIMRVVHASHGRFHHHDLARQLAGHGVLERFFTGYPRWKLAHEQLPHDRISTYPWVEVPYMALRRAGVMRNRLDRVAHRLLMSSFDSHVATHIPECDAFIGLSGAALKTGRIVQRRGGVYVCDRGSSHILAQDRLLREEFIRQGRTRGPAVDAWVIAREQAEYDQADMITVPSEFARKTFLQEGVPERKVVKVSYGVDLARFYRVADPSPKDFGIVFVGSVTFRKGVPDLLEAFRAFRHPRKTLTLIGNVGDEMRGYLASGSLPPEIEFAGHWPQARLREILSRSQVMVLPSIEEGLALVMAQALACGCPVIASENSGARDLFDDGKHGFIVPIRDPLSIVRAFERLADEPQLRNEMGTAAMTLVRDRLRGWDAYGDRMLASVGRFLSDKNSRRNAAQAVHDDK